MSSFDRAARRRAEREALRRSREGLIIDADKQGRVRSVSVKVSELPIPEKTFYANTAKFIEGAGGLVTLAFGQLALASSGVQTCVGFDVPGPFVGRLVKSFDEQFTQRLEKTRQLYAGAMAAFPEAESKPAASLTYPAHLVRMGIAEMWAYVDFFELNDRVGLGADPVLRVRTYPPVVAFLVDRVRDYAVRYPDKEME